MSRVKEEELEFISVNADDDNDMVSSYVDPSQPERTNNIIGNWIFNQSKHPSTAFFHLFFKALALFVYIFGSWFTSSFIFIFVVCIILLAFDFWTVKNISGRLLVGLRWWSYVKDDGNTEWIFESLEDMAELSPLDSRIFWGGLYLAPLVWIFLLIVGLLRLQFEYLPVVIAALVLSFANIVGYMKCSSSAKDKMQSMMEQGLKHGSLAALENNSLRSWVLSSLLSVTTSSSNQNANNQV
jgi:Flp pilus assembly protein TadB